MQAYMRSYYLYAYVNYMPTLECRFKPTFIYLYTYKYAYLQSKNDGSSSMKGTYSPQPSITCVFCCPYCSHFFFTIVFIFTLEARINFLCYLSSNSIHAAYLHRASQRCLVAYIIACLAKQMSNIIDVYACLQTYAHIDKYTHIYMYLYLYATQTYAHFNVCCHCSAAICLSV